MINYNKTEKEKIMLKISAIAKHTVVQMAGCAKQPNNNSCPDVFAKLFS